MTHIYEKVLFRKNIKYTEPDRVWIFPAESSNRICYPPKGHSEVRSKINKSLAEYFVINISNKKLEPLIAALMKVAPNAAIQER